MPKLTGVCDSPPDGSEKVLVTVETVSATVLAIAALASMEVSATITSDSLSFEHPPASATSNGTPAQRAGAQKGFRRDRRSKEDGRMVKQRIGACLEGSRPVFAGAFTAFANVCVCTPVTGVLGRKNGSPGASPKAPVS